MLNWNLASNSVLTVVTDDLRTLTTTKSNPNWDKILEAIRNNHGDEVVRLLSLKDSVVDFYDGNVAVKGEEVWFKNQRLHGLDVERTLEYMRQRLPVDSMVKFLNRKMANPSRASIDQMYKFLENRGMPLTPEGKVLGYKGVRKDFYSVNGNTQTVVLQGKVDAEGHILNEVGATIEVQRNCVQDNPEIGCGEGLHVGSYDYAVSWAGSDGIVILVEFDPADVVSVPSDCSFQKLRACKYVVKGVAKEKLGDTYTSEYSPETDPSIGEGGDPEPLVETDEIVDLEDDENEYIQQEKEVDADEQYELGYECGRSHGKAHKARLYKTPEDDGEHTPEFIAGYCSGYSNERHLQRNNQ